MLDSFFRDILQSKGIIASEALSTSGLMDEVMRSMPDSSDLLRRFKNAYDAYMMMRSDHEMRHKIPDVWQMQLNSCKSELDVCSKALSDFLGEHGLSHIGASYLSHF